MLSTKTRGFFSFFYFSIFWSYPRVVSCLEEIINHESTSIFINRVDRVYPNEKIKQ